MIERTLQAIIENDMFRGKAIVVIGARQVGKSTLFRMVLEKKSEKILRLNCDEPEVRAMLTEAGTSDLKLIVGQNRIVMIDEAQSVPGIGMTLKRLVDNFPEIQLLVTGSSSFELQNEPLTGRKYEYHLFPLSSAEICAANGILSLRQTLEQRLVFGSYPEVYSHPEESKRILMDIAGSYLYKDLLTLEDIRRPVLFEKLLVALALQLSSEVSYNELAQMVGTDNKTVENKFEVLWNKPSIVIPRLQNYKCVIAPDFSVFVDQPKAVNVWNIYRNRWVTSYMQSLSIHAVPSASWGNVDSFEFCFDGLPRNSIIAIGHTAIGKDRSYKKLYRMGVEALIERKRPTKLLVYGAPLDFNPDVEVIYYKGNIQKLRQL